MIISERTRVYTNQRGEQEKVDVFRSYRKVGTAPTMLTESEHDHNGGNSQKCHTYFILVLGLVFLYALITIALPQASNQVLSSVEQQHEERKQAQSQMSLPDLVAYLNSPSNYNKDSLNRTRMASYKWGKNERKQVEFDEFQFNEQIVNRLKCSWKHHKIQCQIEISDEELHQINAACLNTTCENNSAT